MHRRGTDDFDQITKLELNAIRFGLVAFRDLLIRHFLIGSIKEIIHEIVDQSITASSEERKDIIVRMDDIGFIAKCKVIGIVHHVTVVMVDGKGTELSGSRGNGNESMCKWMFLINLTDQC